VSIEQRAVVLLGLLVACGGGSDAETCGDFTPCGGDLVGDWSLQSSCGTAKVVPPTCSAGITIDFAGLELAGTETYTSTNTLVQDLEISGSFLMHWPAACLTVGGITVTCAQLTAASMASMGMGMDDSIERLSCVAERQGCACTATAKRQKAMSTSSYQISGNTFTVTGNGETLSYEYCVAGSTLRSRPVAAASMMTPDFAIHLNQVATRK
jgi:hypothetical protein